MKILSELKRLLLCIGIGKATSLQVNDWTISRTLIRAIFVCIWVVHMLVEFLNCVESLAYGLGTFLVVLHICLISSYTFVIVLSLMSNSDVAFDLFELLECVINRSEFHIWQQKQFNFQTKKMVTLIFNFSTQTRIARV